MTGLTTQEVLSLRQSGQSLAQIAESKGKTAGDVIQAARTLLQTRLKQAVAEGRLTQVQADAKLQEFDARAQQLVNATDVGGPSGGPRFNNPANPTPTPTGGSSA